jgi:hypothetical protein
MKVMSPSANAPGSHRWLHINLAVHGDRELTHPGIVKLLAAAWPPGAVTTPETFMTMPGIVLRPAVAMLTSSGWVSPCASLQARNSRGPSGAGRFCW